MFKRHADSQLSESLVPEVVLERCIVGKFVTNDESLVAATSWKTRMAT